MADNAPESVTKDVRAIKTLLTFGVSDGLVAENPVERLSIPRVPVRKFDIFEPRDSQASLGHATLIMTGHYARQSGVDLAEPHGRYSPADLLQSRAFRQL